MSHALWKTENNYTRCLSVFLLDHVSAVTVLPTFMEGFFFCTVADACHVEYLGPAPKGQGHTSVLRFVLLGLILS